MPIQQIELLCKSINVPGVTFTTNDSNKDVINHRPYITDYNESEISATFYVDAKYNLRTLFDAWKKVIVNENMNIGYWDDMVSNGSTIKVYRDTPQGEIVEASYKFQGLLLKSYTDSSYNWSNTSAPLEITANFTFAKMTPLNLYSDARSVPETDGNVELRGIEVLNTIPYGEILPDIPFGSLDINDATIPVKIGDDFKYDNDLNPFK